MKKLLALLGTLLCMGSVSFAQTTTVSGTVIDSDGTTWTNGTISAQFVPNPSQQNISIYNINGVPLSQAVTTQGPISLGGAGTFSFSVYQNAAITPSGSTWQYTICPNASTKCGVFTIAAVGSTQSLTSMIPAIIPAPRFLAVAGAYGYADIETINQQPVGGTYWNTSASCQKYYNSLSWNCIGTVGGAVIAVTASAPIVSSGGTTPNITCTTAGTSTTGCISSTDWNTFNNKQVALGFTPYNATNPAGYITNSVTTLPSLTISNTQVSGLGTASTHPYTDFEAALGNPASTGYVLSSTTLGVRSWVPQNVGISSINGGTGAYTFNGPVVSCVGTTCTFTDVNPGTVTTVGLVMPSIFTVTNSPVATTGALTASLNSQLQNLFLASPNGSSGIPTFRAIVAADVPILNQNTTGTAANVTGTVLVANGGTGCTTAPCALANLGAASLAGANTFGNVQDYTTTTPVFVGGLNAVTSLTGAGYVRVIGRFAYVTADSTAQYTNSNSDNLSVIDIGNPAAPKIVGQVTSTQLKSAEGLECVGSYCYIVAGTPSNNFVVVNIANPAAPVQVAFLNDATHFNDAVGMTISGKYAYMASGNISGTVYLNTIDISNPSAPVLLSSATSADLAGGADEVIVKGNYAYVCTVNGVLSIWNISNPLSLVETAHIGTVGTYAYVQGRYAYTISTTQLYVLDVSNPGVTPTIIGTSSVVASGNLFTIKVAGRYAYVTDFNSTVGSSTAPKALHVFDIGTPTAPTLATTLVDATNLYGADDVFISGGYAYVTLNNISTSGGLTIFRITGINMTGANIGNLNTDDASVNNDLHVGKDLYVQNGVISGPEGVLSQGPLTVTGNFNVISTAPTSSVGAVSTYSTNSDGEVTGLSAATTVTITFANSGWTHAAFCTAVDNQAATPVANTTQTKLAVIFTFSALTGNLFYHCGGN